MGRGRQRAPQLRTWDSTPPPAFPLQLGKVKPIFCSLPTKDGWLQETGKETEGWGKNGGRGREVQSLWGSDPSRGIDGEFRRLSGEVTIRYPVPAPPLQMRQHRAREGNWLAQGFRASQRQRQSQPNLCLPSLQSFLYQAILLVSILFKKFFLLAKLCCIQDPSSLTRDLTHAPCTESATP